VLNSLVTPAAAEAGFSVRTARRTGSDIIQSTIINALIDADLVIADLTEHNPNVLFELGVRMAIDKPVLLIRAKGTDKIFDVDNMLRVFDYKPTLWSSSLKTDVPELTDHIKSSWEHRSEKTYMQLLKGAAK
jgi:nucleoside 2-deoxyribosyltransferase